jgi:hypothetical protein
MRLTESQLRRLIKEMSTPEIVAANGKIEITVGDEMFNFNGAALINAMNSKKRIWSVNSDGFDDKEETGATIMKIKERDGAPPNIAVFDKGKRVGGDILDEEELLDALKDYENGVGIMRPEGRSFGRHTGTTKLTESQLRRIAKEEILRETVDYNNGPYSTFTEIKKLCDAALFGNEDKKPVIKPDWTHPEVAKSLKQNIMMLLNVMSEVETTPFKRSNAK